MNARVKATGEIIDITRLGDKYIITNHPHSITFDADELDFEFEPDYWEKLKHQAAITAMQGLLSNSLYLQHLMVTSIEDVSLADDITRCAYDYATTLINKLKEEEK